MKWVKILQAIKALYKGQILLKPETWKKGQTANDALMSIAMAIVVFFPDSGLSVEDITKICAGIALFGAVISNYLTRATTTKIGLDPKGKVSGKVYDYIQNNIESSKNHSDGDGGGGGGVHDPGEAAQVNIPLQNNAEPNSVNSGGEGLLGGKR